MNNMIKMNTSNSIDISKKIPGIVNLCILHDLMFMEKETVVKIYGYQEEFLPILIDLFNQYAKIE